MVLTIDNYATVIPREVVVLAEKNTVRECDETEKGHFVAYVDQGADSFDVSITVGKKKEIISHSCDCTENVPVCRHKVALIAYVAGNKTKAKVPRVKAATKKNRADALLDELEPAVLLEWLRAMFRKNKDIELAFVNTFSAKAMQYTPADVQALVKDAIKAVVGTKKKVDAAQMKKLVELWAVSLKPIVEAYHASVMDEAAFLNFNAMLDEFMKFDQAILTSGTRIWKHVDGLLNETTLLINGLFEDDAWVAAISCYTQNLLASSKDYPIHYLTLIFSVFTDATDERKRLLTAEIGKIASQHSGKSVGNLAEFNRLFLSMAIASGQFDRFYEWIQCTQYDNDHNLKLIKLLVDHGYFKRAAAHCNEQILHNYTMEYNVPYLEILKTIYVKTDDKRLLDVLMQLVPYTFNFDDYEKVMQEATDATGKKWHVQVAARVTNFANAGNGAAIEFSFRLMAHQHKYKKMIDHINSVTPYAIILQYFERMVHADKGMLLERIYNKKPPYTWQHPEWHEDNQHFPALAGQMVAHYEKQHLRLLIAQADKEKNGRLNNFFIYLNEYLLMTDS